MADETRPSGFTSHRRISGEQVMKAWKKRKEMEIQAALKKQREELETLHKAEITARQDACEAEIQDVRAWADAEVRKYRNNRVGFFQWILAGIKNRWEEMTKD